MTRHPDIFEALAAPFHDGEVKSRKQGGRDLFYITARTAMNRLDHVLGPENWWDEFDPRENSVLCRLTIRLPDGQLLTKADAGGYAGMSDSGDDDKSGYSDAFKRAAVKFGVARYLYRDGVPSFAPAPAPAPEAPPEDFPRKVEAPAETWSRWVGNRIRRANAEWLQEMVREGVEPHVRRDHRELTNEPRAVNHLVTRLIELGKIRAEAVGKPGKPDVRDIARARNAVNIVFDKSPDAIKRGVEKYLARRLNEARAELGLPDPDAHDADDERGATPPGRGDAYEDALAN